LPAYHVHAKVADFKPNGEATDADYGKLMGILQANNYSGAVSIEWEGRGDAVTGVKKSRDLILKHWPDLPN
jgi:sugar phosphate isomerase/epimerase